MNPGADQIRTQMSPARLPDGWSIATEEPGLFVACDEPSAVTAFGCPGSLALGAVYPRDPADSRAGAALLTARDYPPEELVRAVCGDYVAFLRTSSESITTIIRAPFGRLPCYYAVEDGYVLLGSDTAALRHAGLRKPAFDVDQLAKRLAFRELPASRTCLEGVQQLNGGNILSVGATTAQCRAVWTPWTFAGRAHWLESRYEAKEYLRNNVLHAVRLSSQGATKRLLLLSGGLDSAILAASLGSLGGAFTCLNLHAGADSSDERDYARAVAKRLGGHLIEAQWAIADIDIERADFAARPDPVARSFMQATSRIATNVASNIGADCIIDGGGGDNVFGALYSVAPAVDAWKFDTMAIGWNVSRTLASLAQVGVPQVLWRTAMRSLRLSRAYRWRPDTQLLSSDVAASLPASADHPWLRPPRSAERGTAAQVALIAAAQSWAQEPDLATSCRHISPLASQVMVEACLRVPSWWWISDGRDRAVARDAFAPRLPLSVLTRRSKGTPDSFLAELYRHNRSRIRTMLLEGRLRAFGLIDLAAIELATAPGPVVDTTYLRMLQLADVEAWLTAQG